MHTNKFSYVTKDTNIAVTLGTLFGGFILCVIVTPNVQKEKMSDQKRVNLMIKMF